MQFDPERGAIDWDGLWTFGLTLLLLIVGIGIPLLISLIYVYRTAYSANNQCGCDSLLVFGKRLTRQGIDQDYHLRLEKTLELMQHNPLSTLLLVGGAAPGEDLTEAQAGRDYLIDKGIDESRLRLEQQSQNTLENLQHARTMLTQQDAYPVALISNRYHLARISTIATSLSLNHQLCASEAKLQFSPLLLPRMIIEAWYILWFNTGKSWSRLIRSERMLNRVT
ncbi:MAG: YdcF family protein [Candidatus Thiodiazotropha taylori]|nr:YdcF family protein [Candidatus Thiodiazotropha taylori]